MRSVQSAARISPKTTDDIEQTAIQYLDRLYPQVDAQSSLLVAMFFTVSPTLGSESQTSSSVTHLTLSQQSDSY
jgi:chorismate mutase